MARTITVCGKPLQLRYSMAAAVNFEKMTGSSALELSQFQNNEITPVVSLGYCMLLAANDEKDVPALQELLNSIDTLQKMTDFLQAVAAEVQEFYMPDKATKNEDIPDEPKNA